MCRVPEPSGCWRDDSAHATILLIDPATRDVLGGVLLCRHLTECDALLEDRLNDFSLHRYVLLLSTTTDVLSHKRLERAVLVDSLLDECTIEPSRLLAGDGAREGDLVGGDGRHVYEYGDGYGRWQALLRLHQIELISFLIQMLSALDEATLRCPDLDTVPPAIGLTGRVLGLSHHLTIENDVVGFVLDLHCAYIMATTDTTGKLYFYNLPVGRLTPL